MAMHKGTRKPFREILLNLCGYELCPSTYNDPTIKGPQPRVITSKQGESMRSITVEGTVRTSGSIEMSVRHIDMPETSIAANCVPENVEVRCL